VPKKGEKGHQASEVHGAAAFHNVMVLFGGGQDEQEEMNTTKQRS
jgi:hypothetical protein